jgi:tetratricopeptide (TPR) repeat protein
MKQQKHVDRSKTSAVQPAGSASQYVRAAERYLLLEKFDMAMEQLAAAQQLEPDNQYILAVLERAQMLQHRINQKDSGKTPGPGRTETQGHRYLSVTVGRQFDNGIRDMREDPPLSAQEVRLRVRQHVATAEALLSRGLSENAFESLMKAYLLDPLAPEVLACEKKVLPAWELTRNRREQAILSQTSSGQLSRGTARLDGLTPLNPKRGGTNRR